MEILSDVWPLAKRLERRGAGDVIAEYPLGELLELLNRLREEVWLDMLQNVRGHHHVELQERWERVLAGDARIVLVERHVGEVRLQVVSHSALATTKVQYGLNVRTRLYSLLHEHTRVLPASSAPVGTIMLFSHVFLVFLRNCHYAPLMSL